MISPELLRLTDKRAPAVGVYGGPGMRKTFAVHSCWPPILLIDTEGGTAPLLPWMRRRRSWNSTTWDVYTDSDRKQAYDILTPANQQYIREVSRIAPGPWVDVVWFDVMNAGAYDYLVKLLGEFDKSQYNTLALDSTQEMSVLTQSLAKGVGNEVTSTMSGLMWGPAQERAAIQLRSLRSIRDKGVMVYITCSEEVHKDYVTDPRSAKAGQKPEDPYSVKGTMAVPGQLVNKAPHLIDILLHARPFTGSPKWVSKPEPMPGGSAHWEAKDRFGRLEEYLEPSLRLITDQLYGEETRKAIYAAGRDLALKLETA